MPIVVLVIFIGMFFILNGVYEQKLKTIESNPKIVYKFIPRTYYEEQLFDNKVSDKMSKMFNSDGQPWFMKYEKDDLGIISKPKTEVPSNGQSHDH